MIQGGDLVLGQSGPVMNRAWNMLLLAVPFLDMGLEIRAPLSRGSYPGHLFSQASREPRQAEWKQREPKKTSGVYFYVK